MTDFWIVTGLRQSSRCRRAFGPLHQPDDPRPRQSDPFHAPQRCAAAVAVGGDDPSDGVGLYLVWFGSPADYQQGETVRIMYIHVPAAWLGLFFYMIMAASALGTLVWRHPLADVSQKAAAPIGAAFTLDLPGDRFPVGEAHVGHLLAMGCAAHLHAGDAADLWRHSCVVARHRGAQPGRPGGRRSYAGRRRQHADREILGRLVEHPASARFGVSPRWTDDPSVDAGAAPDHGCGLHACWASACTCRGCAPRSCAAACAPSRSSRPSASMRGRRDRHVQRLFHRRCLRRDPADHRSAHRSRGTRFQSAASGSRCPGARAAPGDALRA